jgi:uncharacterized protein
VGQIAKAALLLSLTLAAGADASPSYNCAKALSEAEREICRVPDLQWFDRQLARLYKLARDQVGANRDAHIAQQRAFIIRREACRANQTCLSSAYEARLAELAPQANLFEAYAEYRSPRGTLWIVRFGYNAGVKILTVGDNGHTCAFEADNAEVTGKGLAKYNGGSRDVCRLNVIPDGEAMRVETNNCQDYCGMRATMDGMYSRAE